MCVYGMYLDIRIWMLFRQAGVPWSSIFVTNSRGLIWRTADGSGSFRNEEQKQFAQARRI